MAAILDLHLTGAGDTLAEDQQAMADSDHSIDSRQSVASTFKVPISPYSRSLNEPWPITTRHHAPGLQARCGDCDGSTISRGHADAGGYRACHRGRKCDYARGCQYSMPCPSGLTYEQTTHFNTWRLLAAYNGSR